MLAESVRKHFSSKPNEYRTTNPEYEFDAPDHGEYGMNPPETRADPHPP